MVAPFAAPVVPVVGIWGVSEHRGLGGEFSGRWHGSSRVAAELCTEMCSQQKDLVEPWGTLSCGDAQEYLQWEITVTAAARVPLFTAPWKAGCEQCQERKDLTSL